MTEEEWQSSADPSDLITHVAPQTSERKLRLATVAAARLVWAKVPPGEMREAVETAERLADGLAQPVELHDYRLRFYRYFTQSYDSRTEADYEEFRWYLFPVFAAASPPQVIRMLHRTAAWTTVSSFQSSQLAPLVRDIFGNPFRPVAFDPRWRSTDAVGVARGIYEDRTFDRMPMLADALMIAECDDEQVIEHCRSEGPHVRGCWVVDLVMAKE